MRTIDLIMKRGDAMQEQHVLTGNPDWRALDAETPEDYYADEDEEEEDDEEVRKEDEEERNGKRKEEGDEEGSGPQVSGLRSQPSGSNEAVRSERGGLIENGVAKYLGVRARVLAPIGPLLEELAERAGDAGISDEDLVGFMEDAARSLPELFDPAAAEEMGRVMEGVLGTAVMRGARESLREERAEGAGRAEG